MVYGGPIVWELEDAAHDDALVSRFSEPAAGREFCVFLGLQTVPPGDPFPKEHWDKKMCVLMRLPQRRRGGG